jgi:FkbM family methyltransferase
MSLAHALYQGLEAVIGRSRAWRLGRWIYLGARRELLNDPDVNGEYALQRAWLKAQTIGSGPRESYRIFDVGANVGAWTVNFLNELKAAGLDDYVIWAFEPAPAQRRALILGCEAAIAAGAMVADPRGLRDETGRALFQIVGDTAGTNALVGQDRRRDDGSSLEIEVTTLDAVCAEQRIDRLHFAKVDTEGNDFNVILGATGLFDAQAIDLLQFEYNWRWIEFGRWLKDVFEFLEGRPYALGRVTPDGIEIYQAWRPELERYIETNYVIVHRALLPGIPHWRAVFDESNAAVQI